MNLDSTGKLLQIVLGEAKTTNDCDIVSSFADSSVTSFSLGNTNIKSNGVTPVAVVAAPGASVQRQVKEIRLFNNDTVPHTVTLQLFDGAATWIISPSALSVPVGGAFVYTPESGVCCPTSGGGTSLTIDDDSGHTIASVGTLTFEGVVVSGTTPHAVTNMTTITGAPGVGAGAGVGIVLTGGAASNTAGSNGGGIILHSGGAGTGNPSYGGQLNFAAGDGGAAAGSYPGNFVGGAGNGLGGNAPGGSFQFTSGSGYGSGDGGVFRFVGGNGGASGGDGADIVMTLGSSGGGSSRAGQVSINADASLIGVPYSWVAGAQLNNQTIFTSTRPLLVTAVIARIDAVNGSAATLVIVKAPSGTAPGAGTPLTSTSADLTGTPDTNQTLTLSATASDSLLAAGDSLCMVTTGALATSAGCITVWGTPQ